MKPNDQNMKWDPYFDKSLIELRFKFKTKILKPNHENMLWDPHFDKSLIQLRFQIDSFKLQCFPEIEPHCLQKTHFLHISWNYLLVGIMCSDCL